VTDRLWDRLYWLSFCDDDAPKGEAFLGVSVVPVTAEEAAAMLPVVDARFPNHAPGAEWIAAASRKAHLTGCNPGGQMMSLDITHVPEFQTADLPMLRLMQKAELVERGLIERQH